jgi:hypothetical protein
VPELRLAGASEAFQWREKRTFGARRAEDERSLRASEFGSPGGIRGDTYETQSRLRLIACHGLLTHLPPKNPSAAGPPGWPDGWPKELSKRGWKLEAAMTNNASEFRSQEFNHALAQLGVKHVHIRAGRPTSNGCVERVQQTLLGGVLEAGLGRLPDAQA